MIYFASDWCQGAGLSLSLTKAAVALVHCTLLVHVTLSKDATTTTTSQKS